MDDVVQLARKTFVTANARCFAVSALASGGLEAVLNSFLEDSDVVAVGGAPAYVAMVADIVRRYGARAVSLNELGPAVKFVVVPLVEPASGQRIAVRDIAAVSRGRGAHLIVDATLGLGACELRVDDWGIDACVAGVDCAVGAPSGMSLVTYSADLEALLATRKTAPRTSYLDLIQLQAYWSPERLNHHTAPTSLVYGLREALRVVQEEGLAARWARHQRIGTQLCDGLRDLGLDVRGESPDFVVQLAIGADESPLRRRLLDEYAVAVTRVGSTARRVGLVGADANEPNVRRVVSAFQDVFAT
jgi:aspartate aminotransferase-like enzyme